jgi:hypothetical protein
MKQSPDERRVMERMAPGVLSSGGFLGDDRRRLSEIIDADCAEAVRAGTTFEALAERLGEALDAAVTGLGTAVDVGDGLVTTHREGMGRIPCPFGTCGTFPKGEVELTDRLSGELVVLTALSVHLLAEHGFCGGRGSRYRLEPATLARLFTPAPRT